MTYHLTYRDAVAEVLAMSEETMRAARNLEAEALGWRWAVSTIVQPKYDLLELREAFERGVREARKILAMAH